MIRSRWRLGKKIVGRTLEGMGIRLVRLPSGSSSYGGGVLAWNPKHGLTSLLHEVAHAALGHTHMPDLAAQIGREAEAWIWAEEACYLWGLRFDYRRAEHCFRTYVGRVKGARGWKVAWRYR